MNNTKMKLLTKHGAIEMEMYDDVAPKHIARISELVKSGFYNGLNFHRVIPGFVAQCGCPDGTGAGRSGVSIDAEFSDKSFVRGTVGMARAYDKNSADCQFFICLDDATFLDNNYTVLGHVTSGMEFVDMIKAGKDSSGSVVDPDKILEMTII